MSPSSDRSQIPEKTGTWHILSALLRPWRRLIAFIAICVLLTEAFAVVPALLLKRIVDDHLTAGIREGVLVLALLYLGAGRFLSLDYWIARKWRNTDSC